MLTVAPFASNWLGHVFLHWASGEELSVSDTSSSSLATLVCWWPLMNYSWAHLNASLRNLYYLFGKGWNTLLRCCGCIAFPALLLWFQGNYANFTPRIAKFCFHAAFWCWMIIQWFHASNTRWEHSVIVNAVCFPVVQFHAVLPYIIIQISIKVGTFSIDRSWGMNCFFAFALDLCISWKIHQWNSSQVASCLSSADCFYPNPVIQSDMFTPLENDIM